TALHPGHLVTALDGAAHGDDHRARQDEDDGQPEGPEDAPVKGMHEANSRPLPPIPARAARLRQTCRTMLATQRWCASLSRPAPPVGRRAVSNRRRGERDDG